MDLIEQNLLREVADLDGLPTGAYNLRENGKTAARNSTANIEIIPKTDKPGIDIRIHPGTRHESVHIPVILSESGLKDLVYNDFYIGEGSDVVIIAGCGISNCGNADSEHDGIHTFYVAKNAKVRYIEKHYGEGEGRGKRLMNPTTIVHLEEGAVMEMETAQIAGVDDTLRITEATLAENATLEIKEKILTTGDQHAESKFTADLNGENSSCNIISPRRRARREPPAFLERLKRQGRVRGPHGVRLDHHGPRRRARKPAAVRFVPGREPNPRGGHRQDCRRAAH